MRESVIEDYLVEQVKLKKGETRKVKWVNRRGAPDRLCWIPKWKFPKMPELKAPGEPLKPHQIREHAHLQKMGLVCVKLDSFEDVDKFLGSK